MQSAEQEIVTAANAARRELKAYAAGLAVPFVFRAHAAAPSETTSHASFGANGMALSDMDPRPFRWEDGASMKLPGLLNCQRLANLAVVRARFLAEEGKAREAADLLLDVCQFARDIGVEARKNGLINIFVSNGFDTPDTVAMMDDFLDCITVDFKGSGETNFVRKYIGIPDAQPIFQTIQEIKDRGKTHIEITDLIDSTFHARLMRVNRKEGRTCRTTTTIAKMASAVVTPSNA